VVEHLCAQLLRPAERVPLRKVHAAAPCADFCAAR
jgi:hypothetical protein